MRPPRHPLWVALLSPAAALYRFAVARRNRHYDRPGAARRAGLPVISVGNLTVGGTGKTPLVAWLAQRLAEAGRRPAVVTRGYGGSAGRGPLLVSGPDGPACSAAVSGDEPYLLVRTLPGTLVVAGSDRLAGAEHARQRGADVVLLDDGFQHRRLARELDIVLLDAGNPFGNRRLLPAGLLREPLAALARAGVVVVTRSRRGERFPEIERIVRRHNEQAPLLTADHVGTGFVDAAGVSVGAPQRALAFCGIGNPARFRLDLESAGIELVDFRDYPDHHRYTVHQADELSAAAAAAGADLVTTEKDLVRLAGLAARLPGARALRIAVDVHEPARLLRAALLAAGGAPA